MIILNFHGVGPITKQIDEAERDYWLDRDRFEAILDLVQGQKHIQLTFDDGNNSDLDIVLPMLMRRGMQAAFFVCSGRLDQPAFLSRSQVRELREQGMEIGSHGIAHISWKHLHSAQLRDELEGSRRTLEDVCGYPVEMAACPFGDYDRKVLNGLRQAGYRHAFTSDGGTASEMGWLQARTTVTRGMTVENVEHLVRQGIGSWEQGWIECHKLFKRVR